METLGQVMTSIKTVAFCSTNMHEGSRRMSRPLFDFFFFRESWRFNSWSSLPKRSSTKRKVFTYGLRLFVTLIKGSSIRNYLRIYKIMGKKVDHGKNVQTNKRAIKSHLTSHFLCRRGHWSAVGQAALLWVPLIEIQNVKEQCIHFPKIYRMHIGRWAYHMLFWLLFSNKWKYIFYKLIFRNYYKIWMCLIV